MELDLALEDNSYDFDYYIKKLNEELQKKEAEIKEAKEKIKREEEKREYEKKNIDLITRQSLNVANDLREGAENLNEQERKEVEISAMNIEKNALEKEIKIKKDIIKEKETEMNRILADKVFYEAKIKKIKKEMNAKSSLESKVKIETLKNCSKSNSKKYFEFLKQNEILKDSVIKAQSKVGLIKEKLNLNAHK